MFVATTRSHYRQKAGYLRARPSNKESDSVKYLKFIVIFIVLTGCAEKTFDPDNPEYSYGVAKEPYDDKQYDIALKKLGEFKARFPYSKFATEAELLLANTHFEMAHYPEAATAYAQFVKLHPKHPEVPFALYRVGESYWKDAPEEIDREQEFTSKAIDKWEVLLKDHPGSSYANQAKEFIKIGHKRVASAEEFIAKFYCKREIWHACAFRYIGLSKKYPEFRSMYKNALIKAAMALDKLADNKLENDNDSNIYFKTYTPAQLHQQAATLRKDAEAVKDEAS